MPNAKPKPQNRSLRRKHASRIAAVQALYAEHYTERDDVTLDAWVDGILSEHEEQAATGDDEIALADLPERALLLTLLESVEQHETAINTLIETSMSDSWSFERLGPLMRALLTIGIAEMMAKPDRAKEIIITEYVSLAEEYFDKDEISFIHAILDTIAHKLRQE